MSDPPLHKLDERKWAGQWGDSFDSTLTKKQVLPGRVVLFGLMANDITPTLSLGTKFFRPPFEKDVQ